jgi:hypothetical protein
VETGSAWTVGPATSPSHSQYLALNYPGTYTTAPFTSPCISVANNQLDIPAGYLNAYRFRSTSRQISRPWILPNKQSLLANKESRQSSRAIWGYQAGCRCLDGSDFLNMSLHPATAISIGSETSQTVNCIPQCVNAGRKRSNYTFLSPERGWMETPDMHSIPGLAVSAGSVTNGDSDLSVRRAIT